MSRVRPAWHMTASATTDAASTDAECASKWPSAKDVSSGAEPLPAAVLDVEAIMKILPHRYPFLLLDRVIAYEPGQSAIGIKSVSINEPFFPGHFPTRPIMPGVLQVEALAQLGGIVMLQPPFVEEDTSDIDFFFGGVDKVKWRKPVVPGDTLVMEISLSSFKRSFGIAKMEGRYVIEFASPFVVVKCPICYDYRLKTDLPFLYDCRTFCRAFVNGQLVVEGQFTLVMVGEKK